MNPEKQDLVILQITNKHKIIFESANQLSSHRIPMFTADTGIKRDMITFVCFLK